MDESTFCLTAIVKVVAIVSHHQSASEKPGRVGQYISISERVTKIKHKIISIHKIPWAYLIATSC